MTHERLQALLDAFPRLRIAVLGDFYVDKYLHIDPDLTEVSIETGLDAYQVVEVRCQPGAAGTVTNNLSALGVGRLEAVGFRGQDGEGYELVRGLEATRVGTDHLHETPTRMTPTYTKPLVMRPEQPPQELNRLDHKNRSATAREVEDAIIASLQHLAGELDAIIVGDQVQERNFGVVSDRVRAALAELGKTRPDLVILADSRVHIHLFDHISVKPNVHEAWATISDVPEEPTETQVEQLAAKLSGRAERPAFVTMGADGVMAADVPEVTHVPGIPVSGPIDIVGAGDSFCAGAAAALAAGATAAEAGMVGCLVASLTVQQIGTTGTASPEQVLVRLSESPYLTA